MKSNEIWMRANSTTNTTNVWTQISSWSKSKLSCGLLIILNNIKEIWTQSNTIKKSKNIWVLDNSKQNQNIFVFSIQIHLFVERSWEILNQWVELGNWVVGYYPMGSTEQFLCIFADFLLVKLSNLNPPRIRLFLSLGHRKPLCPTFQLDRCWLSTTANWRWSSWRRTFLSVILIKSQNRLLEPATSLTRLHSTQRCWQTRPSESTGREN